MVEIGVVKINKPDEVQFILGHASFIKTVEDLYEAMVTSVPNIKFGLAFAEASGPCLIRLEGNDEAMRRLAEQNMLRLSAGHTFMIFFKDAYPINIVNAIKSVPEVVGIHCATANSVEIITVTTEQGVGVLGVVDGFKSRGIEEVKDKENRVRFLRELGYKR